MSINRFNPRRDFNELPIVRALEAIGCTVRRSNFVDLVVGYRGKNWLIEVKRDAKAEIKDSQKKLINEWKGQYDIVYTAEQAIALVTK